ncbi:MoaD/ThiS family protein [Geomonas terrae]|uniref:MoaD/ThiS family protein n=1 Tax=Geomonas terrae TaxID=2562681 RepID=A0A4S1CAJ3_9BACT|nr:MoaD/ThiS family protein [Geomonas terrae]TGU70319.1 MoaD/ThiS family protein [Geomonas terrae]
MVLLQIYGTLRMMLGGRESVELPCYEGDTVGSLLERFQAGERIAVTHKLVDDRRMLHTGTIILLNRRNILHLDKLETPVRDGDVLALFPPGAGG